MDRHRRRCGEQKEDFQFPMQHAVEFIIETVMKHPGEITLVPIGPLTNIATALIREPKISSYVKEIVIMGGVTRLGSNRMKLETMEHNVKCDPEAASVVFSSGAPIVMIGLDVTRQLIFSKEKNQEFTACGTPLAQALTKMIDKYMNYMNRDFSYMCDPLAISVLIDRSLVQTEQMKVHVEYDHREMVGQTIAELSEEGNVQVALEVDYDRFFQLLLKRVFS